MTRLEIPVEFLLAALQEGVEWRIPNTPRVFGNTVSVVSKGLPPGAAVKAAKLSADGKRLVLLGDNLCEPEFKQLT